MVRSGVKNSFYARPGKLNDFRIQRAMNWSQFSTHIDTSAGVVRKLNNGGMTYRATAEKIAGLIGVDPSVIFIDYCEEYKPDSAAIDERNHILASIIDEIKWTSMKYGKALMKVRGCLFDLNDIVSSGYIFAIEAIDKGLYRRNRGEAINITAYACGAVRRGLMLENRFWHAGMRDGNTLSYEQFIEMEDTVASAFDLEEFVLDHLTIESFIAEMAPENCSDPRVADVLKDFGICVPVGT